MDDSFDGLDLDHVPRGNAVVDNAAVPKPRVFIVINSLDTGGAEATCQRLATELSANYKVTVFALLTSGLAGQQLQLAGIEVIHGTGPKLTNVLFGTARLRYELRLQEPVAVISFLYVADLVAGLVVRSARSGSRVVWNVRNNVLNARQTSVVTYIVARLNAVLSHWIPDRVVYCSDLSRRQHEVIGFDDVRSDTVENCASASGFSFSAGKRAAIRDRLALNGFVFLFMARADPLKRVDLFLAAAARVAALLPEQCEFVVAGRGMEATGAVAKSATALGMEPGRLRFLGQHSDPESLYCGADCLVVTSETEGSPNVVYEAIATKLPVLIAATVGTEHIAAEAVTRLSGRSVDEIAKAMIDAVSTGSMALRLAGEGGSSRKQRVEHPLTIYYRQYLER